MADYEKKNLERLILIERKSYLAIGKIYGVSGNAIKKAARKLGIELPERRKVNKKENFSHPKKNKQSLVFKIDEKIFIEAVKTSTSWFELAEKIGYSNVRKNFVSKKVKKDIIERSLSLGLKLNIQEKKSLLEKTKKEVFCNNRNWQSARSTIRRLAQQIYMENNKETKCAICGYSKHIEVAHIRAVSDFPDSATIREINSIDNLIALCPNHHWEYDNGILEI